MLRNYLTIAFRNLFRHRVYTTINIVGLAVGMACCILVLIYVREEFRVGHVHENGHRIFRILRETLSAGSASRFNTGTSGAITPAALVDFPEVEKAARIINWQHWFRYGDKQFVQRLALADASILEMFGYSFVRGNPESALSRPGFAVVTESAALRCFGREDPIGKTVTVNSDKLGGDYTITGVLKDSHRHAHLSFDFVTAYPLPQSPSYFRVHTWSGWRPTSDWRPFENYLLLREGASLESLEEKMPSFIARYMGEEVAGAIVRLLVLESVLLVVAATLIASPIAFFVMNEWLQAFAYSITLGPDLFLIGGGLALASAMLAVAYQAISAATANPVDTLRHE